MRFTIVLFILGAAALGALAGLAPGAQGSKQDRAVRTPLERSVMHDQASAGAIAQPRFKVVRVRCRPPKGYCDVKRKSSTRFTNTTLLLRVPIVRTRKGGWRYRRLDAAAAQTLASAREDGRLVFATSSQYRPN